MSTRDRWLARGRAGGLRLLTVVLMATTGIVCVAAAVASHGTDLRADSATSLRDLVTERADRVAATTAEVASLTRTVAEYADAQGTGPALERARRSVAQVAPMAGFTPMVGPSLTVELDDAPRGPGRELPVDVAPDDLVVHQQDVQAVVNALWRGGAQGMQIMDQRIISTSAVRCVGNTLILQGRVYSPPYRITAVGDQAGMQAALDADPQVTIYRGWVSAVGLGYLVDNAERTTLPAFEGALPLTSAVISTPADGQ